jgi:hypothetical protein
VDLRAPRASSGAECRNLEQCHAGLQAFKWVNRVAPRTSVARAKRSLPSVREAAVSKCNKDNRCVSLRVPCSRVVRILRLEDFSPSYCANGLCQRRRGRPVN